MAATRCTDQWHDSTVQRVLGLAWQTVAVGHSLSAPKPTKPGNKEQTGGHPEMGKVYSGNICPVFRQNWRDADDDQIGVTVTSPIPHPGVGVEVASPSVLSPLVSLHDVFTVASKFNKLVPSLWLGFQCSALQAKDVTPAPKAGSGWGPFFLRDQGRGQAVLGHLEGCGVEAGGADGWSGTLGTVLSPHQPPHPAPSLPALCQ